MLGLSVLVVGFGCRFGLSVSVVGLYMFELIIYIYIYEF